MIMKNRLQSTMKHIFFGNSLPRSKSLDSSSGKYQKILFVSGITVRRFDLAQEFGPEEFSSFSCVKVFIQSYTP